MCKQQHTIKYFIISDIHGDFNALITALKENQYNPSDPTHQLISLGDNFGRAQTGQKSKGVWKYLISSIHYNKPICIRGNHESMLLDIFKKGYIDYTDIRNGEDKTISSFAHCSIRRARSDYEKIQEAANTGVKEWIEKLPWYFEGKTFICTHGWLPQQSLISDLTSFTSEDWHIASWCHTVQSFDQFQKIYPNGQDKLLVVGHWSTIDFWKRENIESYDIYRNDKFNVAMIDGCTALTHKVNVLIIEE